MGHSRVVIVATETAVALFEDVDLEWVPRGDHDPDSDVKLAIENEHWVLYVFLDHPGLLCVGLCFITSWFRLVIQVVLRVTRAKVAGRGQPVRSRNLLGRVDLCVIQYLLEVFKDANLASTGESTRLDDPQVVQTVHFSLRVLASQLLKHLLAQLGYPFTHVDLLH